MNVTRSIVSASLVRPVWQHGASLVEGPDEDAFTLELSALQQLGRQVRADGPRALRRVHVIGPVSTSIEWAYGEALGIPGIEIRRHPPGAHGLWGALAAAAHDEGPRGREAVVGADLVTVGPDFAPATGGRHDSGAVAFLFGEEAGLSVRRHGFRGHAPGRSPSMKSSIAGWVAALDLPSSKPVGEIVFSGEEDLSRWQSAWEETAPGTTVTIVNGSAGPPGQSRVLPVAQLLWELGRRLRSGGCGAVVEAARGRTEFAGFRLDGPVRWLGGWGGPATGLVPPGDHFLRRDIPVGAVSQGAYVPLPRYLENLGSRWRLEGDRCTHCRSLTFPVAGRCRSCGRSDGLRAEALPRTGLEVEAVTTISSGAQPTEFDGLVEAAGAYDVALVALGEGARATVQVTDSGAGKLHVGDRVGLVLRRLYPMEGEWRYGLKAVPETRDVSPPGAEQPIRRPSRPSREPSSSLPTARRATPRARGGRAARRRPAER